MISDDERREVARRLRELAGGYVTIGELESALGICLSSPEVDLERDARDLHRLADLIEPTCDHDALLELANDMAGMFRIGAVSGEGLDAKWCRELHDKYASCINNIIGKE